ncbi:histidine kinase [Hymenobacter sp. 5317J-9]|uniref:sensor histidine kinase n=1 Tax=Hymenobacter sp. 5317J-9 TaxID=2932250 RepID=UPI001FD71B45|nr:histidine kinase [Hymenobacter sp. 5317J-9]UOQ98369.1 histidine kinase [Hymenobacter sp. 5317J-9]
MTVRIPEFIRQLGVFVWPQGDDARPSSPLLIRRDVAVLAGVWVLGLMLLLSARAHLGIFLFWNILALSAATVHSLASYRLIPGVQGRRRPFLRYLLKALLLLVVVSIFVGCFALLLTNDNDGPAFGVLNGVFQLLFTVPLSWTLYRRRARGQEAIEGLKQELGQSEATLELLRSQINPHFLFNALNTLYGTALQENGERTAQGIQMLGDMMRFMLHENHQPRILLARELEYLRNYVELQSLRIATSPGISIDTALDEVPLGSSIAPMLLIPFVENAFKHGISLQHKSWIKVSLHVTDNRLYFDVYNSIHPKSDQSLPDETSGLGLANVRQRLALLYPGRHELAIRQTLGEYFVHLTLEL